MGASRFLTAMLQIECDRKKQQGQSLDFTLSAIQLLDIQLLDIVTDGQHDNQELLLSHITQILTDEDRKPMIQIMIALVITGKS